MGLAQDCVQHHAQVSAKIAVTRVVQVLAVTDAKVGVKGDVRNNVGTIVQDNVLEDAEVIAVEVVGLSVLGIV